MYKVIKNLADLSLENPFPIFWGVSLSKVSIFHRNFFNEILSHMPEHCPSFLIIVADSLEVINYKYRLNLSEAKAVEKSLRIGTQAIRSYERLKVKFPFIEIKLLSEFFYIQQIQVSYKILSDELRNNELFRLAVWDQITKNLEIKIPSFSDNPHFGDYILGEYATTIALYDGLFQKTPIQLSVHTDELLKTLYEGYFQNLKDALNLRKENFRYLELQINGKDRK